MAVVSVEASPAIVFDLVGREVVPYPGAKTDT